MEAMNPLILQLIDKNTQVQKALHKCARQASDREITLYFRNLSHDFRRINSILLESRDDMNEVNLDTLNEIMLRTNSIHGKRWLHRDSIFAFDNDSTLLEEVGRAMKVICEFYDHIRIPALSRILAEIKDESNGITSTIAYA